jgi:malonate transporter
MSFALPASLFVAVASAPRREMIDQAPLALAFGICMLVLFLAWYVIARTVLAVGRPDASLQALTLAFPNLAGVALPIVGSVLGPAGIVPVAVALATGSIVVTPIALLIVEMSTASPAGQAQAPAARIRQSLRRAVTKPVVIAPLLGGVVSFAELPLPPVAVASLGLIGQSAAGVALFLTGLILSAQPFQLNWRILGATCMADIVRPLLAVCLTLAIPMPPMATATVILLAAVPSGFFGILFGVTYRLDSATMGSMVTASTLVSIATMAIAIARLFPH